MPSAKQINREYKEEFQRLTEALGRTPSIQDSEWWELTDWYRDQFDVDRITRTIADRKERADQKKYSGPVKVVEKVCATCENIIPLNRRGKAPKHCDECKAKMAEQKTDRRCKKCNKVIPSTGKRGRPATICNECKG